MSQIAIVIGLFGIILDSLHTKETRKENKAIAKICKALFVVIGIIAL